MRAIAASIRRLSLPNDMKTIKSRLFASTVISVTMDSFKLCRDMGEHVVSTPVIDDPEIGSAACLQNHMDRLFLIGMARARFLKQKAHAQAYMDVMVRHQSILATWSMDESFETIRTINTMFYCCR